MLTVYGRATSSNVQVVMWLIAELEIEVERLDYGFNFGGNDTPEFLAMNPHGLVPVLRDGELVMWESGAILRYLAARYGASSPFWPEDPATRARADMWAEWGKTTYGPAFIRGIFWPRVRMAAKKRDAAALAAAIAAFEGVLDKVEAQLGAGPFLLGDTISMADLSIGHLLYRWFTVDVPRRPRPALEAYYERLQARPAYATHVMVDYSVLADPEA